MLQQRNVDLHCHESPTIISPAQQISHMQTSRSLAGCTGKNEQTGHKDEDIQIDDSQAENVMQGISNPHPFTYIGHQTKVCQEENTAGNSVDKDSGLEMPMANKASSLTSSKPNTIEQVTRSETCVQDDQFNQVASSSNNDVSSDGLLENAAASNLQNNGVIKKKGIATEWKAFIGGKFEIVKILVYKICTITKISGQSGHAVATVEVFTTMKNISPVDSCMIAVYLLI